MRKPKPLPKIGSGLFMRAARQHAFETNQGSPSECWPWRGRTGYNTQAANPLLYGQVRLKGAKGKTIYYQAHRIAFLIANREDPLDKIICHSCDNPICQNPAHLFAATPKENTQDAISKGRLIYPPTGSGEKNPRAVLNHNTADYMRSDYASGLFTYTQLGKKYGVSKSTAHLVISNQLWKAA